MFILARFQWILLMNIVTQNFFFKYLAFIIIDIVNSSYGLTHNEKEYLL